ncbi:MULTISPECIES: nuclear transport factor 2 family protein [unclassified Pseudoalteromonas]|uniref:nuclear transport factor 2 family protein n=1 Tax=unclassified Pseudoalteromonas TaxID=194690 RepID=UPI0030148BD9
MTQSYHEMIEIDQVKATVKQYFTGLHYGDTTKLKAIFHHDTQLKAPNLRRNMSQWLALVDTRVSPYSKGKPFAYRVLSIDIVHHQAMVKVYCPLFEHHYIDFLGLLKEDGKWKIVSKMYDDIAIKGV